MSSFSRLELIDFPFASSSLIYRESSSSSSALLKSHNLFSAVEQDQLDFALDLLAPSSPFPSPLPFNLFFPLATPLDLLETDLCLRGLTDRIAALEFTVGQKPKAPVDWKYKWTTEIKGAEEKEGFDRKYKVVAEVKAGGDRDLKWTAEMKGKGKDKPLSRTYTFQKSTNPVLSVVEKEKEKKKEKKGDKKEKNGAKNRLVEIEEPPSQGAVVLRQAFAKRTVVRNKGKNKELSPLDAALIIQMSYRAHLVHRSKVLHALRDLAVAKSKLKEIRCFFSNFSYRRRIVKDHEERQRFSEKSIVLLLTVEAIEGLDFMIRAAKRSMIDELEAMLEVVDPQPAGKLASLKRRQFDLPMGGLISDEMARGVSEVVQMLDQDEKASS